MTYEEFQKTGLCAKMCAIYRLTGNCIADFDIYLGYLLKEQVSFNIDDIRFYFANGAVSTILKWSYFPTGEEICFKNKLCALEYPEYSIFVTNMSFLFSGYDCTELDLSEFDTRNVRDMSHMFSNCTKLENLNLSSFNTSKVMSMRCMFHSCKSLEYLDLTMFDITNVEDMSEMFSHCRRLKNIDLAKFNTHNTVETAYMFLDCTSLEGVDLSNFHAVVKKTEFMFKDCTALRYVNLQNIDTSVCTCMDFMFYRCTNLEEVRMGYSQRQAHCTYRAMFDSCNEKLKVITNDERVLDVFNQRCETIKL